MINKSEIRDQESEIMFNVQRWEFQRSEGLPDRPHVSQVFFDDPDF
jgi:hypothetical protein